VIVELCNRFPPERASREDSERCDESHEKVRSRVSRPMRASFPSLSEEA
jgi:hypothetical protein